MTMKSNRVEPLLRNEVADELQLGDLGKVNEGAILAETFKKKARKVASVKAITQAKISSTQWKDKATRFVMRRSRSKRSRIRKPFNVVDTLNGRKYKQATLSDIEDDEESASFDPFQTFEDGVTTQAKLKNVDSHSKALLHYFAKVSSVIQRNYP